ncbi:N-acetylglucosamine-6-phosphate deacetylase [Microbacterium jiangjiandongii]|uniref:N-acetylglucosamine-6-phosphate deacetylase n=1 Tax=Microbacterium jiangjiandongii TaxID=3049071 RepID=UPI00214D0B83|nr:N-acetylglucosamine-6-phosphate deacetylase [Microbacterium sp. zg.Y843]MCR2815737.1 N-acetylglucosamine-6-phosphate deacetylase [Microbacterium sp. zg.Y843]
MQTPGVLSVDRVVHRVRLVDAGTVTDDAWVAFGDGRVRAVGQGDSWRDLSPAQAHDGDGAWLTPGFVDIHGHGGAGHAFDDGAEAIAEARAMHRSHGTTRAVLSLVTASVDDLVSRVATIAGLARTDATVLGSHLEGPFLDVGHKGAHTAGLLRAPDARSVDRLLDAGDGTIRQVTLAPELPGAPEAIARFVAAGVAVAVGHTDADADAARRAFDAGATILTHAFNGMRGIHHRAPGPVVAAMQDERVTIELIADGTHVHPDVMRLVFAGAPGRVALITDAMAAAGSADGAYALGGLAVTVADGVARLDDGGSIAGSTLTQDAALRMATGRCGVSMPDAIDALTAVPARVIGAPAGSLAVGAAADAVLLDADLAVRTVWVDGVPA